ncbi:DUF3093 domain-containing protein [Microlunatus endophyticus]
MYRERLWVPVGWWVLTGLFALSLLIAVLFYLGPAWGLGSGVLVMVVMGGAFLRYGREEVRVERDRLWVGGANIEWPYIAQVRVLDEHATRRRRGPDSDARAYLVLRPYLNRAVEVTIADRTDPTPYWLISSRRPQRLAEAIASRFGADETNASADAGADAVVRPQVSPPRDTVES